MKQMNMDRAVLTKGANIDGFQRQQHKQTVLRMHEFVALTWLPVDVQIESITTANYLWSRFCFYNKQNMFAS